MVGAVVAVVSRVITQCVVGHAILVPSVAEIRRFETVELSELCRSH